MTAEGEDFRLSEEPDVEIIDESAPGQDLDPARIERLVRFVLAREGATGRWAVTVVLTSDQELQRLHRDFMGIDETTDVMTFPFDPADGPNGGEIVVSVERAAAQGPDYGHTVSEEVDFLVVHGLLHLLGWDDAGPEDRTTMLARQSHLLDAFGGSN